MKKLLCLLLIALLCAVAATAGDEDEEESVTVDEVSRLLSVRLKGQEEFLPRKTSKLAPGDRLRTSESGVAKAQLGLDGMIAFIGPKTDLEIGELLEGGQKVKLNQGRIRGYRARSEQRGFELNTTNVSLAARGTEWVMEHVPVGGEATKTSYDMNVESPSERTHSLGTRPGETRVALFEGSLEQGGEKLIAGGDTMIIDAKGKLRTNPPDFKFKEPPKDGKAFLRVGFRTVYIRYHLGTDAAPVVRPKGRGTIGSQGRDSDGGVLNPNRGPNQGRTQQGPDPWQNQPPRNTPPPGPGPGPGPG